MTDNSKPLHMSEVKQDAMSIAAASRKLVAVKPDKVRTPAALEAIAEHKTKKVGKQRRKNKAARVSRRRNR